ncbi:DUF2637 domain-containing protein [Rhodococcus sp. OK302]|uniref:DUF2637 domain-containing protein n=1 Tax=Rhodococcus sp. OK302 TaxID=1882769 RepID=UPI0034E8B017
MARSSPVLARLARQAKIPERLAWIFPVIVDSAILGSTIAIVFLSKLKTSIWDKGFYIALAGSVVAISILGNAYHAFHAAVAAHTQIAAGEKSDTYPSNPRSRPSSQSSLPYSSWYSRTASES